MDTTVKPTDSELEILNILWAKGPSTVREIHEVLTKNKDAGYTTTLKLMQIMNEKGLVRRDETNKSHIYSTNVSQEKTQGHLVKRMIDNVFNGSASQLVLQALGHHETNDEELKAIKAYLEEMEQKAKRKG